MRVEEFGFSNFLHRGAQPKEELLLILKKNFNYYIYIYFFFGRKGKEKIFNTSCIIFLGSWLLFNKILLFLFKIVNSLSNFGGNWKNSLCETRNYWSFNIIKGEKERKREE